MEHSVSAARLPTGASAGPEVEVFMLGAAQDGGFPQFGCYCPNCSRVYDGSVPSDTAVSLAIIDRAAGRWFLVEAAPQLHEQWGMLAGKVAGLVLSGVFLTHAHVGHYPGLLFLGKEGMNASGLPLYASSEMHMFLQSNEPWGVMYKNGNFARVDLQEHVSIKLTDGVSITPQFVAHRRDFTDTCAFTIFGPKRRVFFCPDIDSWEGMVPDLPTILSTVDIAMIDATFYDNNELPGRDMKTIPHPRVVQTLSILRGNSPPPGTSRAQTVLIHLNHSNRLWVDEELQETLKEDGILVGCKGMVWSI
jgi:pyrroloquinoline quinone biosynthesis protein B